MRNYGPPVVVCIAVMVVLFGMFYVMWPEERPIDISNGIPIDGGYSEADSQH